MEMSFKYIVTFNNISRASPLISILIDIMIFSNQRSFEIKSISSTTSPTIIAHLRESRTSKISTDCSEPCSVKQDCKTFLALSTC